MAKKVKTTWLGARADDDLMAQVAAYVKAAEVSAADLVRDGVLEYMRNHPVKPKVPDQTDIKKPGQE